MLPIIGIALAALIAVVLVAGALKPPRFRVERSTLIAAAPQQIFPYLADFRKWRSWSPWEDVDSDLKRTYSGADSGRGAVYEWDGKKAGAGRMEILDASPPRTMTIALDFTRPFEAHNTTEYTLEASDAGTRVVWAMHGPQPFMFRVISVFKSMDSMVGPDFEKGLARLKTAAEASARPTPSAI
jgi:hypothetical protein